MANYAKGIFGVLAMFFLISAGAQDILIKTDKTEIKVKVVEITDISIKYKKWDNQSGPLYNISKKDVFMIVYANGQRETIWQDTTKNSSSTLAKEEKASPDLAAKIQMTQNTGITGIDTSVDYKNIRLKYKPTRIMYWFDGPPTVLGIQQEVRILKNKLNLGFSTDYFFISGYSQILYSIYAAPYLPLNRVLGDYEKQDKGLFINAKVGYSALSTQINGSTESTGGLMLGGGLDYFITKKIGISVAGFKFKDSEFEFQGGVCFNIL